MKDQRTALKIKIKNLADEARTIRVEEKKVHGRDRWELQQHRRTTVRSAARRTLIAYQWIRERDWETNASTLAYTRMDDWSHIERMVKKYGSEEAIIRLPNLEAALKLSRPEVPIETRETLPSVDHQASDPHRPVHMGH